MTEKRGYSAAEAAAYVGVKRPTFEKEFRPRLVAVRLGTRLIFDKVDLDRVFEQLKAEKGEPGSQALGAGAARPSTTVKAQTFEKVLADILAKKKAERAAGKAAKKTTRTSRDKN